MVLNKGVCARCGKSYQFMEFCPKHEYEPLLDPEKVEVLEYLVKADEERKEKLDKWILVIVVVAIITLGLPVFVLGFAIPVLGRLLFEIVLGWGAELSDRITNRIFRPKYSEWTDKLDLVQS